MATVIIEPVHTKTTNGYPATIRGIDPTDMDCLIGEITTPGMGQMSVRWDLGGLCRDHDPSCNLDMKDNENFDLRETAKRLGAK